MNTGVVDLVPFGLMADFRNGINFSSDSRGDGLGSVAVIGVGAFQANERISAFADLECITVPGELADGALLRDGDLVFVRSNGNKALIGRCMKVEGVDRPLTHSGFTIRARLKQNSADAEWVLQFFASGLASRAIARLGHGTNISNLSQDVLQRLEIAVPSEEYERHVLKVSDRMSQLDKQLRVLVDQKRALKRGLAQQLLTGKKRFPEFSDQAWSEVPLGHFFQEKSERNVNDEDLPVYSCTKTAGIIPQTERFFKRLASKDLSRYKIVSPGDLVYDPMLLWDGSIGFVPVRGRGVVSPAYATFSVRDGANMDYLRLLLKSYRFLYLYKKISRGTNTRRRKAHPADFLNLRVLIPDVKQERNRIAECLELVQKEIDLLIEQRRLYEQYKRGLMSRLLSGDIQIPA